MITGFHTRNAVCPFDGGVYGSLPLPQVRKDEHAKSTARSAFKASVRSATRRQLQAGFVCDAERWCEAECKGRRRLGRTEVPGGQVQERFDGKEPARAARTKTGASGRRVQGRQVVAKGGSGREPAPRPSRNSPWGRSLRVQRAQAQRARQTTAQHLAECIREAEHKIVVEGRQSGHESSTCTLEPPGRRVKRYRWTRGPKTRLETVGYGRNRPRCRRQ